MAIDWQAQNFPLVLFLLLVASTLFSLQRAIPGSRCARLRLAGCETVSLSLLAIAGLVIYLGNSLLYFIGQYPILLDTIPIILALVSLPLGFTALSQHDRILTAILAASSICSPCLFGAAFFNGQHSLETIGLLACAGSGMFAYLCLFGKRAVRLQFMETSFARAMSMVFFPLAVSALTLQLHSLSGQNTFADVSRLIFQSY